MVVNIIYMSKLLSMNELFKSLRVEQLQYLFCIAIKDWKFAICSDVSKVCLHLMQQGQVIVITFDG